MAEEVKGIEIEYEIISDEDWPIVGPEGKLIPGRRIAFATADIPYDSFVLTQAEYSPERIEQEIKKRVLAFKKKEKVTGKIVI